MKNLGAAARNVYLDHSKSDDLIIDEKGNVRDIQFVPKAEIVLTSVEADYQLVKVDSPIEGGAPKMQLVKVPRTTVERFHVTIDSLKMLMQTLGMTLAELSALDASNVEPTQEAAEKKPSLVLVS